MTRATHTLLEFKEDRRKNDASARRESPREAGGFDAQFERCRTSLELVARRVLGGERGAEEAVQRCHATAKLHPRHFESEGAFRSWLLRILIEEALNLKIEQESDRASRDIVA